MFPLRFCDVLRESELIYWVLSEKPNVVAVVLVDSQRWHNWIPTKL